MLGGAVEEELVQRNSEQQRDHWLSDGIGGYTPLGPQQYNETRHHASRLAG